MPISLGSLPRCDVRRGRSPRFVQRTTPWLVSVDHVTHLDQSEQDATNKETAAVKTTIGDAPSWTVLCCHQLLSGRRRKSVSSDREPTSRPAARSRTVAARRWCRMTDRHSGGSPGSQRCYHLHNWRHRQDTKCDNGLVPIQVGVEAIFLCSECNDLFTALKLTHISSCTFNCSRAS